MGCRQRDARGRSLEGTDIDFLPLFLIRSSAKAMEKGGDDVRSPARFDTSRLTGWEKKQPVIKSAPGILSTILDRAAHRIIDIFGPFANYLNRRSFDLSAPVIARTLRVANSPRDSRYLNYEALNIGFRLIRDRLRHWSPHRRLELQITS